MKETGIESGFRGVEFSKLGGAGRLWGWHGETSRIMEALGCPISVSYNIMESWEKYFPLKQSHFSGN